MVSPSITTGILIWLLHLTGLTSFETESPNWTKRLSWIIKQLPIPEISCSMRAGCKDEHELQKYRLLPSIYCRWPNSSHEYWCYHKLEESHHKVHLKCMTKSHMHLVAGTSWKFFLPTFINTWFKIWRNWDGSKGVFDVFSRDIIFRNAAKKVIDYLPPSTTLTRTQV